MSPAVPGAVSTTLGALAVRFGCELQGDPDIEVDAVATLQNAAPRTIAFLANPKYRKHLASTRAAAVILDPKLAAQCPVAALLSPNPYALYARIAAVLHPEPPVEPGIHARAVVEPGAQVDPTASVGAGAVIEPGARIGARARIGSGCVVMANASVGADTRLVANVTLGRGVVLGERCLLHPGVVVGGDGFGLAPDRAGWVKVPQVGTVRIGNDVEIGSSTTIDRGAIEDTVIEDGVKLDNQIQIGHNVRVGAHTAIAGCTGVSGSTTIGSRCLIGGMVGIAGHLTIADDVVVTGRTFVNNSIAEKGTYSGGLPMDEAKRFRRNAARFRRLDELARRVNRLDDSEEGDDDED
ncbi:MAG TPA: UDP-3-O-(3-hydroxymyristoyl)glucosamine N-acyltransferase [Steroidobacteraceae bacterium]|nr:UDP-3-O-(3-hydroxymyristoyl)glucosamine N-acyltransferase [Steroidobacteraceae bacterium]